MKKKEAANEKLTYEIAQENKKLTEPLTRALKEVEELRRQLANYEKVRRHLDVLWSLNPSRAQYAFYGLLNDLYYTDYPQLVCVIIWSYVMLQPFNENDVFY